MTSFIVMKVAVAIEQLTLHGADLLELRDNAAHRPKEVAPNNKARRNRACAPFVLDLLRHPQLNSQVRMNLACRSI